MSATEEAALMLKALQAKHGPLMLFQSGGCCDGSLPICLKEGELMISPSDLLLGKVAGVNFYVDQEQYERWGKPHFVVDVGQGEAEGFSFSLDGKHLITHSPTN